MAVAGAEQSDEFASGLGADIRALRKARHFTLQELALRLGRSVGWLSQVERGLSEPAIGDLRELGKAFDVPIGFFFQNDDAPAEERGYIVRGHSRRQLGNDTEGLREELLSPDLGGSFEVFRSVFEPGAELKQATLRETEEAGYLLSGELELWIGARHFTLHPGDSFRFENEPIRWRNAGANPAIVIWVISPPVY